MNTFTRAYAAVNNRVPHLSSFGIGLLLMVVNGYTVFAQAPQPTPAQQTAREKLAADSRQEWERTLAQLNKKIPVLPPIADDATRPKNLTQKPGSTNWYDAADNTIVRTSWGRWSNYTEENANNYVLTNPLKMKNGTLVKDAKTWMQKRRPEILNDFETEIFGKVPANTPKVNFEVTAVDNTALNGTAIKKTIVGHIDNSRYPAAKPEINLTVYLPANAKGPVPLILVIGNLALPRTAATANNTPVNNGPTVVEQVLALGWAVGSINPTAIQADNGAGLKEGIIGLVSEGKPRKPDDWGALRAWSWGLSRAIDYFETDPAINSKQLGLEGHSRWGKTAVVAAATDPRWAVTYSSCAGDLGTSLEKRDFGGTVDNAAGPSEFHWMAANFLKYGGDWQKMPVDAHDYIALIAPRPLFVTGGTRDLWSDPKGEFDACVAASPVYALLGKKGVGTTKMPAPDVELISGEIGFRNHEGGHTDQPDWPVFLKFAKKYFKI